jgi:peptidoglycan/xylan/chitin deacetylase (PgdA/CDA1 family)
MNFNKKFIIISLIIILTAIIVTTLAINNQSHINENNKGQIMLSFDDQYIDNWFQQSSLFNKYNAKICFYVTRPNELTENDFNKLILLQNDGHMIGSHGMHHLAPNDSISAKEYYEKEILPTLEIFSQHNLKINSFAYPFGKGRKDIDNLIISNGLSIRYSDWNWEHKPLNKLDRFFYNTNNSTSTYRAIGIDRNYKINRVELFFALKKAKDKNLTLCVHAHDINSKSGKYRLNPSKLEFILKQCDKMNISYCLP